MNDELMHKMQEANQMSQNIEEQLKIVEQQIMELQKFSQTIEALEKNDEKEFLSNVGKGVFMKSEIKDKKLFVDVGSGIFIRKSVQETKEVIDGQLRRLQEMKIQLTSEMTSLNSELEMMIKETQGTN